MEPFVCCSSSTELVGPYGMHLNTCVVDYFVLSCLKDVRKVVSCLFCVGVIVQHSIYSHLSAPQMPWPTAGGCRVSELLSARQSIESVYNLVCTAYQIFSSGLITAIWICWCQVMYSSQTGTRSLMVCKQWCQLWADLEPMSRWKKWMLTLTSSLSMLQKRLVSPPDVEEAVSSTPHRLRWE